MSQTNAPIFIVGSERSGTTLLMTMLGAHSRIAVPEVAWYYPRFRAFLHTYGSLAEREHFRTLLSEMIFGLKTPFFGLNLNPATIVDELEQRALTRSFAGAYRAILELYADHVKKPRWGEKTPHNLFYIKEILQDFPNAKIINLIRDGRDVAVEQLQSAFGPTNIYAAALIWKRTHDVAEHWRRELPSDVWLDVRYEDLVQHPEDTLRKTTAFLNEAYEPELLHFYLGDIARRRGKTKDHRQLGGPVSTDYIGLYQRHLSLHEQAIFSAVAGQGLLSLGYTNIAQPEPVSPEQANLFLELDGRIRAATLDAPEGHIVYESYNDWLADQREERRKRGIWSDAAPTTQEPLLDWDEEFFAGQRAPSRWKQYLAVQRRYVSNQLVL